MAAAGAPTGGREESGAPHTDAAVGAPPAQLEKPASAPTKYHFVKLDVPLAGAQYAKTLLVSGALGAFAKWIMNILNTTHYYDMAHFRAAHEARPAGRGLVTVSNHVSAVDDPGVLAALVDWEGITLHPERVRWTLCATDRCYKSPWTGPLLSYGKTIPVQRGQGLRQPFMDDAVALLDAGEWLHLFPEGRRTRDGALLPLRPGVGRLVADATPTPVVVPVFHRGMEQIMGIGGYNPVQPGHHLSIRCGAPLEFQDLLAAHRPDGVAGSEAQEDALYRAITARIQDALYALEAASTHDIPWESSSGTASAAARAQLGSWAPASYDKAWAANSR